MIRSNDARNACIRVEEIVSEVNIKLIYDYTEDVQFAVDSACFISGDYYNDENRDNTITSPMFGGGISTAASQTGTSRVANDVAISVVGSCKVSF